MRYKVRSPCKSFCGEDYYSDSVMKRALKPNNMLIIDGDTKNQTEITEEETIFIKNAR